MTAALPRSTHFRESRSARERAAVASWEGAGTSNGRVGRALLGHRCVTPPIGHPTHPFAVVILGRQNDGTPSPAAAPGNARPSPWLPGPSHRRSRPFSGGEMNSVTFTVATPPSVNSLYRNVAGRGRVRTQRYIGWLNAVGWDMEKLGRIEGPYEVEIRCAHDGRRDLDGYPKALLDALVKHNVTCDDRHLMRLVVEADPVLTDKSKVHVTVRKWQRG